MPLLTPPCLWSQPVHPYSRYSNQHLAGPQGPCIVALRLRHAFACCDGLPMLYKQFVQEHQILARIQDTDMPTDVRRPKTSTVETPVVLRSWNAECTWASQPEWPLLNRRQCQLRSTTPLSVVLAIHQPKLLMTQRPRCSSNPAHPTHHPTSLSLVDCPSLPRVSRSSPLRTQGPLL